MYSVVCKNRRKKDPSKCAQQGEESTSNAAASQVSCQLEVVPQKSDDNVGRSQSALFHYPTTEPCYESIGCGSLEDHGRRTTSEPAYASVDANWKKSRRKKTWTKNRQSDNLYESIENLATGF